MVDLNFAPLKSKHWKKLDTNISVAGVTFRFNDVVKFAHGSKHDIELQHDPKNTTDRNAIKVFGIFKGWFFTKKVHIGFVPTETVYEILRLRKYPTLLPVLRRVYHNKDIVSVKFDLLIPANHK